MLGNQLVLGDVDEQILLGEKLNSDGQVGRLLHSRSAGSGHGNVDAGIVVAIVKELSEGAQVLDTDGGLCAEFDVDCADGGFLRFRTGLCWERSVLCLHKS